MVANSALPVHFVEILTAERFRNKLLVPTLDMRSLLKLVPSVHVLAAKSIYEILKRKAGTRIRPSKKTMFARSSCRLLKEYAGEKVR